MSEFKTRKKAQSVLALCFAEAPETYHHWRVFSHGSDGVCLQFDKDALVEALEENGEIRFGTVTYSTINNAASNRIKTNHLPFLKRYPYKDEKEFRIIYVDMHEAKEFAPVPISLSSITRIILSPWIAKPLANAVISTLRSIEGCEKLKIYRSTLVENERWKHLINPKLK
jgi:hypothetical protein